MSHVHIRVAAKSEHVSLSKRYDEWGYHGGVNDDDTLFVAELNARTVGLVRRTHEGGLTLLRGMYVDPAHHRERIGTALLDRFVHDLGDVECFCLPFTHLTRFYGSAGFAVIADDDAPPFLVERLRQYREEERDVLIMRRASR